MTMRETSAEIDDRAAEWAVRIDHAPLAAEEQAALDAWIGSDMRRLGALARAQAIFEHAHRTRALGSDFDPDAYVAQTDMHGPDIAHPAIDPMPTRRRMLLWGGSAAAIAASGLAVIGMGWRFGGERYATKRGEVRLVPLADGSQMTLNTATETKVSFGERERRIELGEGEALFDVAKDKARPFIVSAGDTEIRAVGTSFTVRRLPGRPVQVIVREGIVDVRQRSGLPPHRVTANNRAITTGDQGVQTVSIAPAEVGRALAWREGMLSFEDQSLAEAAEEFARYSNRRIILADPELGRETITGLYAANNPQGFARSAALSLGLEAEMTPDGIILRR